MSKTCGTTAYLPASYIQDGCLDRSVDTHCYGITIFDLITGKSPISEYEGVCLSQIMTSIDVKRDQLFRFFDRNATGDPNSCSYHPKFLLQVGRECAHKDKKQRRKMGEVVRAFKGWRARNLKSASSNYVPNMCQNV